MPAISFHGRNFIGYSKSAEGSELFTAVNPASGLPLPAPFHTATDGEVDRAVRLAKASLQIPVYFAQRVDFLEAIATNLAELDDNWLDIARKETGLTRERLVSERTRTIDQLRLFARLVAEGSWVDARIDLADPRRAPIPKPDFRRMLTAIGPVAVFGASNFPFAYSVAGGDTVSAFAAGNPVIVKGHPAHPGTSELAASAIVDAAKAIGMPDGTFSMLHGGNHVGIGLIRHDDLAAAGFTGSVAGGRALLVAAGARARPIPVHAEMGSTNPVFLLPDALEARGSQIAVDLAQSVCLGVGQYCTNPGLVIGIEGPDLHSFRESLSKQVIQAPPGVMLTAGIHHKYLADVERWEHFGANSAHPIQGLDLPGTRVGSSVYEISAKSFLANHQLTDEVFGPATLLVICANRSELLAIANALPGQLTATIHGELTELKSYSDLIHSLSACVGRLIFNGYPTSVEVTLAMNHGGPYPASSDVRFTSVGTAAIYRFARPLCYQNAPDEQLPLELQNSNPRKIKRLVDGIYTAAALPAK
jgi:alpha-ketoglutaric semialdehyde dehydrogenase